MPYRRSFILSSVAIVGGAIAGIQVYEINADNPGEQAVDGLIENLSQLPGAVRFGDFALNQQNNIFTESTASISIRLHNLYGDFNNTNIGKALEKQIQSEFHNREMQKVDGWYLSRTEADLCILASLTRKG